MSDSPASASPGTWVSCPKCAAQVPCYDPARSEYFCCFNCRTYFRADPSAAGSAATVVSGFKKELPPGPSLPLGATGVLAGYHCRVTGYQVRSEKKDHTAEWREYQLRPLTPISGDDPIDFPLQLAEYQGHWLLIRRAREFPTTENPRPKGAQEWTDQAGRKYQLWHRYQPIIRDAQGEFDWNILDDEALNISEYTAPPYILSSEQLARRSATWYLAEHLEPRQVAAAFGLSVSGLPMRQGIGAAQPGPIPSWPHLLRVALAAVVALVLVQTALVLWQPPRQLLAQTFTATEASGTATSQVLVSEAFTIAGPTALNAELQVPNLDNHWVEVTASLVNEQTGRGYEFTRSVEYYHGYEGGESWSEGSHSVEAVLRQVPSGRYHFNLYPSLDKGVGTAGLSLRVTQNTPLWSNFFLALLGLGLVPALLGWRHTTFERERWAHSDFNPYSTD
ncbi:MAG: DUF4178 domain-containing protein [Janthinobacterium lividum]